ncbi:MAG: PIN domain-containing protein [Pseudomonadota bacterium]|nr:PIN domain-containing protein [Pseudomonadota bacterium]
MIAVDAGFLYALVDQRDAWHARARAQAPTAAEGWITTWPVLTEATHLMTRWLGSAFAAALMEDVGEGGLAVWEPPHSHWTRIAPLMRSYAKLPMDLADATLLLLADHLGHGRILSTDERDFRTYRWKRHKPFHNLLAEG